MIWAALTLSFLNGLYVAYLAVSKASDPLAWLFAVVLAGLAVLLVMS